MDDSIKSIYYDPETGYSSINKIYRKVKEIDSSVTRKEVKDFIDKQSVAQITKNVIKPKNIIQYTHHQLIIIINVIYLCYQIQILIKDINIYLLVLMFIVDTFQLYHYILKQVKPY